MQFPEVSRIFCANFPQFFCTILHPCYTPPLGLFRCGGGGGLPLDTPQSQPHEVCPIPVWFSPPPPGSMPSEWPPRPPALRPSGYPPELSPAPLPPEHSRQWHASASQRICVKPLRGKCQLVLNNNTRAGWGGRTNAFVPPPKSDCVAYFGHVHSCTLPN